MVNATACLGCFSVCFIVLLGVGVGLFAASFGIVNYNQAALHKNKFSVQIDSTSIYYSGRYFIGVTGTFIKYDTTWQTIIFSSDANSDSGLISAKTSESASVNLEVTLMYRLKPEFIYSLYQNYPNQNQKSYMVSVAQQAIQQAANKFALTDFFVNREVVSATFAYNISSIFKAQYSSEVTLFLLKQIQFADSFEQQYLNAAILLREQQTSQNSQQLQIVTGQIAALNSEGALNASQFITNANAQASNILAQGAAQGDALILQAQVTAYQTFQTNIFNGTNGQANLLRYLFYDQVSQSPKGTTYAGFSDTITFNFN